MPKNKKNDFDAASINREQYMRENYLVKETSDGQPLNRKRQMLIASMLSVLLVCLAFLLYWSFFVRPQNEAVSVSLPSASAEPMPTPFSSAMPATPSPVPVLEKYTEYRDMYPDIVGWISIDNIKVDYPVVQSDDPAQPLRYIDLGPDGKSDKAGSIFLDSRNSIDATDRHTIIYGHNMKNGSMFGQLDMYLKKSFFDDHLIIRYDTLYQELEWEVINVFITTIDFYYIQTYFDTDDDFVNLMTQCVYKSYYNNNKTVISPEDRILTLSTCTNGPDDERLVIQARLITPLQGDDQALLSNP